ncbi:MAG TPA: polysaccharide biosynthesis protein [Caulobacterales bacterium]|nr:polysaccharide biosynthesis protein [Caulobacterales bacterium]
MFEGAALVAGTAAAVRAALLRPSLAKRIASLSGAILVGADRGEVDVAVHARVADWTSLDLSSAGSARTLILAEPLISRQASRAVLAAAAEARMKVALIDGDALRPMTIGDVIGRSLARVDWDRISAAIAGKRVLITGGGGSIGGELARRIAALGPARLTLLDNSEFNLFSIGRELPQASLALADIRDAEAIKRWFAREKPELVFHAGALKQVPLVEAHPCEGVRTNVGGCRIVADASIAVGADMVFVSTDKAVNPSGVMGASKRLGELYCQALDRESARKQGPRIITVRLGNVLGSAGSVSPLFERQLEIGAPLTVTDAQVTRYFITIPQAADFLLQAAAAGIGSRDSRGHAYVLDMGEPLAVVDLARKMIQLTGQRPEQDVDIVFVGLRPGEKLHEELVGADEWREPDPAPGVMAAASPPRGLAELNEIIERLTLLWRKGADAEIAAQLRTAVAPAREKAERELRVAS